MTRASTLAARLARIALWIVALFYCYGAMVHVLNMAGLSGFSWSAAPLKWQVLDVVYLILDIVVAVGFFMNRAAGFHAFYIAAVSQIVLYTLLRAWIIDVPSEFAVSAGQVAYLDTLVVFHLVTLVVVTAALMVRGVRPVQADARNTGLPR